MRGFDAGWLDTGGVNDGDGPLDVVALALRLGADGASLPDGSLRLGSVGRCRTDAVQRVVQHQRRDAPGRDGAARILFENRPERLLPGAPPEGVEHRDAAEEVLLRGRGAGIGELHGADRLVPGMHVLVMRERRNGERAGKEDSSRQTMRNSLLAGTAARWSAFGYAPKVNWLPVVHSTRACGISILARSMKFWPLQCMGNTCSTSSALRPAMTCFR